MSWIDDELQYQAVQHECPTPLRAEADQFAVGAMVFTPAGRWETVVEIAPYDRFSVSVTVRTDRASWLFWPSDQLPYLPSWEASADPPARVAVCETETTISVEVIRHLRGRGHPLLLAARAKGAGWLVQDRPDGATSEQVTVESRAKARSEVRRRARSHAKRLGLALAVEAPGRGARHG